LYVAVPLENRVLVFPLTGGSANTVLGQPDFTSSGANYASNPLASRNGLSEPADVKVDAAGNVYVVDSGNNRALAFAAGTRSATQVWGQATFTGNGPNQIKPASIDAPFQMAIDYSQTPYALYVSDARNHRVLVWRDSVHYLSGDPADLVIGQPDLVTAIPNVDTSAATPTATSLYAPKGLALDPSGNLYVADSGNNRVLFYPRPVSQSGRIAATVVLGQTSFTASLLLGTTASSLHQPAGLALGPGGELFVADAGNNRVLEFLANAKTGDSAIRVFGQPNFNAGGLISGVSPQTLNAPAGVFVDASYTLYVADTGNNRVLAFTNIQGSSSNGLPATLVFGQNRFDSSGAGSGAAGLSSPTSIALDSAGNIYVSDTANNRVAVYPSRLFAQQAGTPATGVAGQPNLNQNQPDWDSTNGLATPDSLFGPLGIYLDRQDTLYVGDSGNNRVVQFLRAAAIVNAADYLGSAPVAPGSVATMFGTNLASYTATASGMPLPASLAGRQVVINDLLNAPLFLAASGQMNFQVPSAAPVGTNRLAVRTGDTGELIAGGSFVVAGAAPGLFSAAMTGLGQAIAVNQDGQLNGTADAAPRGSVITLYGTGQGAVSPPVADGAPAPAAPLSYSVTLPATSAQTCLASPQSICVVFGNSSVGVVQYSGLAPGWVGLWQINVTVPSDASTGNAVPVKVVIDGAPSNAVTVAIK
jgi:uncharacterized protein (TIGR03437 family)